MPTMGHWSFELSPEDDDWMQNHKEYIWEKAVTAIGSRYARKHPDGTLEFRFEAEEAAEMTFKTSMPKGEKIVSVVFRWDSENAYLFINGKLIEERPFSTC